MKLAVIVPVYNGGTDILECLRAIATSKGEADQIIVVDDGSTDNQAYIASKEFGCTCIRLQDGPGGPARARNIGALHASDDVDALVFIDADVVVSPSALESIRNRFLQDPGMHAMFGSYDDKPRSRATVSLYRNLLHHYVHQTGNPEARTFWAGCGSVRMNVFRAAGGFSENYGKPSIEDIEFGARLHQQGYNIRLCPDIQVKHLKHWTLGNMIRTDVLCRAIPWTRLLRKDKSHNKDLNLETKNKVSAVVAILFTLSLPTIAINPQLSIISGVFLVLFLALEHPLLRFFHRTEGPVFAVRATLLQILYYWYATAAFAFTQLHLTTLTMAKKFQQVVAKDVSDNPDWHALPSIAQQNNLHPIRHSVLKKRIDVYEFAQNRGSRVPHLPAGEQNASNTQPVDKSALEDA